VSFSVQVKFASGVVRGWSLTPQPLKLGRGEHCSLRINDPLVSREHCVLWSVDDQAFVKDLDSANATVLNGEPVSDVQTLRAGDVLALGSTLLEVVETAAGPVADDATPVTVRFDELEDRSFARHFSGASPRTTQELLQFYWLARGLAEAEDLADCVGRFYEFVVSLLPASRLWLGISIGGKERPRFAPEFSLPAYAPGTPVPQDIEACMHALYSSKSKSTVYESEKADGFVWTMPIGLRGQVLGVVQIADPGSRDAGHDDLTGVLLGGIRLLAPNIRAMERETQHRLDERRLRELSGSPTQVALVGSSSEMESVRTAIRRTAAMDIPVMLQGETGTGKDLAARLIHQESERRHGPFVAVNCAAVPETLFESLFFGHAGGAFTDASSKHVGYFEEANGGTLFLDEVVELSPSNQARLLRALESRHIRPIGNRTDVPIDVRCVSATNAKLSANELHGFRSDLYFRLCGMVIEMPPLRERVDDISELVDYLREQRPELDVVKIDESGLAALQDYDWPGNVRELRMVVERLAVLDSPAAIRREDVDRAVGRVPNQSTAACNDTAQHLDPTLSIAQLERLLIERALAHYDGNVSATARSLGINRVTLYKRMRQYSLPSV